MRRKKDIKRLYENLGLDEDMIWHKTKILLEVYRDVVWAINNKTNEMVCEVSFTYGRDFDKALEFLRDFAPDEKREQFEKRVSYLFETRWLIDLIDRANEMIKAYPSYGEVYSEILDRVYFAKEKEKDTAIMMKLSLEKTTFYKRKKEAISLMGVSIWGYALNELKEEVMSV